MWANIEVLGLGAGVITLKCRQIAEVSAILAGNFRGSRHKRSLIQPISAVALSGTGIALVRRVKGAARAARAEDVNDGKGRRRKICGKRLTGAWSALVGRAAG